MRRRFDVTTLIMWAIGALIVFVVIWGSINTLRAGTYSKENWIDFIIFGIAQGCLYALIALGYTLVYGILRMINFAHGEVFMARLPDIMWHNRSLLAAFWSIIRYQVC